MASKNIEQLKLQVVHGSHKYDVRLVVPQSEAGDALCLHHLMTEVFQLTQIPHAAQRLIYKGKSLKDPDGELFKYGLKNGCKVMLIGKKSSPEDDATVKAIREVELAVEKQDKKLSDITYELDGIHRGFLEKSLQVEAVRNHEKQLKLTMESLMRFLERLDSILISEENKEARAKRKSLVDKIQVLLTRCDGLSQGVDHLKETFS